MVIPDPAAVLALAALEPRPGCENELSVQSTGSAGRAWNNLAA